MISTTSAALFLAILTRFVSASNMLDNVKVAAAIQDSANEMSEGEYQIYNPASGKYMMFSRLDTSMSLSLSSDPASVFLSTYTSGGDDKTKAGTTGTMFADGDSKCAASAWNFETAAFDENFIPYACPFGPYKSRSASTIVDAKFLYQIVDCPSDSSNGDDGSSKFTNDVKLATVSKGDCPKDIAWVSRHQEYTDIHPACAAPLKAYLASQKRMVKRSHQSLAQDIQKRELAKRDSNTKCIIATDHLENQATRAVSAHSELAFSDITGLLLHVYDNTAADQHWVFKKIS